MGAALGFYWLTVSPDVNPQKTTSWKLKHKRNMRAVATVNDRSTSFIPGDPLPGIISIVSILHLCMHSTTVVVGLIGAVEMAAHPVGTTPLTTSLY